jgi:hypothetical protein
MSVLTKNSPEHENYWSLRLLALLQEMVVQNTNAVLTILSDVDHLETECRYPESGLLFADKRWRVFYHCHEAISMHPDEHGHFHLFTDIGNQAWAHVVGLSIDAEGQPLQWFMVNRWVTDGPWLERAAFPDQLKYVAVNDDEDLVESWLGALLKLYSCELSELLKKRDEQITFYSKEKLRQETMDDREIYMLATQAIGLQFKLEKYLLDDPIINNENVQQGV